MADIKPDDVEVISDREDNSFTGFTLLSARLSESFHAEYVGEVCHFVDVTSRFADSPHVIAVITASLERTLSSGKGLLPDAEAAFLADHSGLSAPESGPGSDDYAALVAHQAVVDDGAFVSTAAAADLLGIDPSRVRHRAGSGQLISARFGRELRYPLWQFDTRTTPAVPIAHLKDIREALRPDVHPAETAGVMTTPQEDLSLHGRAVSACEWLHAGGAVEPVLDILRNDVEW
jgi:hypothetical protein